MRSVTNLSARLLVGVICNITEEQDGKTTNEKGKNWDDNNTFFERR